MTATMTQAVKDVRISSNLRQIEALKAEQARVADAWLSRGLRQTEMAIDILTEQVVDLYEEIDSLVGE